MTTQRQVLITGGSRGIGFDLARWMLQRGDRVLVTGRSQPSLDQVARQQPGMETTVADASDADARRRLADEVAERMPDLDLLVQNAGIQRRVALAVDDAPWEERQVEIDTLLCGPVHLDHLLVPVMLAHGRPARLVQVTSGGAVVPQQFAPLYSAAKAALHHYVMVLRASLADTAIRVTDLMPPAVATGLGGSVGGAPLDDFGQTAMEGIDQGLDMVGFGPTADGPISQQVAEQQQLFEEFSNRFPVARYKLGTGQVAASTVTTTSAAPHGPERRSAVMRLSTSGRAATRGGQAGRHRAAAIQGRGEPVGRDTVFGSGTSIGRHHRAGRSGTSASQWGVGYRTVGLVVGPQRDPHLKIHEGPGARTGGRRTPLGLRNPAGVRVRRACDRK
ncbi:MAG: SDR family NAD(P)-dependent oxidoreductase [Actinobacteria bacterium]|nr:SDR family NAD(P)-dependent oxidoreductase [Actinomycetota bacterium]